MNLTEHAAQAIARITNDHPKIDWQDLVQQATEALVNNGYNATEAFHATTVEVAHQFSLNSEAAINIETSTSAVVFVKLANHPIPQPIMAWELQQFLDQRQTFSD